MESGTIYFSVGFSVRRKISTFERFIRMFGNGRSERECMVRQVEITAGPYPKGIHLITALVERGVGKFPRTGIMHVFIRHTSAALAVNENADPSVRHDMESWLDEFVPEGRPYYIHTAEGDDDMPSHIKAVLCGQSVTVPVKDGRPAFGTWQGIYLCEFRRNAGPRGITVTVIGED